MDMLSNAIREEWKMFRGMRLLNKYEYKILS